VLVDLTLAGDNAIVVGLAASSLAARERRRAILAGTLIATLLRVILALVANRLLAIIGLTLAGGILLAWVAWKMFREFAEQHARAKQSHATGERAPPQPQGSFRQVLFRIVAADLSMSLDNVLAVAGSAGQHFWVLVVGLALSIALMGIASHFVAALLHRVPWLVWIGVAVVASVALTMIYQGWHEIDARL